MTKRIAVLIFIFVCASMAWIILGAVTTYRTEKQDNKLRVAVGQLWGTVQKQKAPTLFSETTVWKDVEVMRDNRKVIETISEKKRDLVPLESSDVDVALSLEHRRKGLLWYSTYSVSFSGTYLVINKTEKPRKLFFEYRFPVRDGIYDDFTFEIDGNSVDDLGPTAGLVKRKLDLSPGEGRVIHIAYESQGLDEWWYVFGSGVSQMRNFALTMSTDFDDIDFPENSISPTSKEKLDSGWRLNWEYANLVSGIQIGMDMPRKLNPGPFVSKVSFFAPVSLFFFFFIMFMITTIKNINIHPMNYFFIAAAFFSFHLLLAYLVDHINLHLACAICSAVSIFLVISYMRLVVGVRFALVETGFSQFVYLVLFSYAFFLEGYTGLAITTCSIVTLFVVMQYTGRIDWSKQLKENRAPSQQVSGPVHSD
jgi:inner membrane protein involved in colicin E2 resistance